MSRSSFAVRAALGCTLLAPAFLSFVHASAAPTVASTPSATATVAPAAAPALKVGINTAGNAVTFTPSADVAAVRVQVTSSLGNQLYNSGWMTGSDAVRGALTWHTLDDKGAPLSRGLYLTLVEVRGADGTTKTESGSLQLEAAPAASNSPVGTRSAVSPNAAPTTITGAGTTNTLALWTSASTIGDSIVTQQGSNLTVNGLLSVTGVINAPSISVQRVYANTSDPIAIQGYSVNGNIGIQGNSNAASTGSTPVGVDGVAKGDSTSIGVRGTSTNGYGMYASSSGGYGLYATSSSNNAVKGVSSNGYGVYGVSTSNAGVTGTSNSYLGVFGQSASSIGVYGTGPIGVQGTSNSAANSYAGVFYGPVKINGNLQVTGTLSKGGGSFRIDDPTDPAHKYLSHSFVESPDMMNIYNGNATTDAKGYATIQLPKYFGALNRDCRYQLTTIGSFAHAIVAQEVKDNRFVIRTDAPDVKVSWQVTGIRRDPWANDHRIPTQQLKTGAERGRYLYPAGYHQPASKGIDYIKTPPAPRPGFKSVAAHTPIKQPTVRPATTTSKVTAAPRVAQAAR